MRRFIDGTAAGARGHRTRREVLADGGKLGIVAAAGVGLSEFLRPTKARADTQLPQLPSATILAALPPSAPPDISAAIEAGCCIHYTRDEGHCGSGCPSGYCCYHVTSAGCGLNEITCVHVKCSTGNFTTGC